MLKCHVVKYGKPFTKEQAAEFEKACKPVAEFMKNNCSPMMSAVISGYDYQIVSIEFGGDFKEPEL